MKDYTQITGKAQTLYMGIDVHKQSWTITIRTRDQVLGTARIAGLDELLKFLAPIPAERWRLVYEAGFSGFWLQRALAERGIDCMVTTPSLIPVRSGSRVKTDKIDSRHLAECLASGLLKSVYVPSAAEEAKRELLRQREQFVRDLVRAKNRIKGLLARLGLEVSQSGETTWSHGMKAWLRELDFGQPEWGAVMRRYLAALGECEQKIKELDQEIAALSKEPEYATGYSLLQSLPGVGPMTAMALLLELSDISRFSNSRQLAAYVGLTPSQYSSGEKRHLGRITRSGKPILRRVLVEAAWRAQRLCPRMGARYQALVEHRGKKRAAVALARKMLLISRKMLLEKQAYDPSRLASA